MINWGEKLEEKIRMLPDSPGCYLMKDASGEIIYVGKAVNLKNRVRSYFRDTAHTPKVAAMIAHIDDFDILLCETNLEALILECNLIKRHKPYYNILLKDDKHYPYLKVDMRQPFPRLELCRKMEKDGAKYFGPYIGANAVRQVIEAVRDVFPIRSCKQVLPPKSPKRPCMNYDIGRCLAPCAGKCTEEAYREMMEGVLSFLGGDYDGVLKKLRKDMEEAAAALRFEKAAAIRDKIRDVQGLMERQIALRTDRSEQDLIALAQDGLDAMIQILYVRGGRMVGGDHFALPREGGEEPGEVIASFLTQYYEQAGLIPRNVLCQTLPEGAAEQLELWLREKKGSAVTVATPQRGEKHELVLLAEKNARDALMKRNARRTIHEERTVEAAKNLGKILGMDRYPRRIEGYDISNTQGVQSVAAMVVFIDGEPAKKEYRHFRIKTVEGANDFASLYETLSRRYAHAAREAEEGTEQGKFTDLPDLILIDGGPQQLRFARQAILDLGIEPPAMFGLAERLEEIWLPDAEEPILLDHRTPELQLVQRVRNEAHRFGIIHHRALRGKASIHSQLEDIPGVGPARRKALLKAFGSLKAIKAADLETLAGVPGMNRAAAEAVRAWAEK
ncbi:excinuclease ABC subunit UvrC [Aristaeella hokkaidonensis]|uniref:Excinuclease ABC subunit UvrC n=1 Tax=Aristaeella hokkaidonensis TaxID=3046382 RepID=A0AC61MUE2_9FIRM|nr:excinuclease ABC subunit UvrC [Aristaeella hokkaidonensis]QUC65874.1 excinuclease ABC subunit UvrC [Aristaeella hokkaidonensis]